jgi:hypothetical protein
MFKQRTISKHYNAALKRLVIEGDSYYAELRAPIMASDLLTVKQGAEVAAINDYLDMKIRVLKEDSVSSITKGSVSRVFSAALVTSELVGTARTFLPPNCEEGVDGVLWKTRGETNRWIKKRLTK